MENVHGIRTVLTLCEEPVHQSANSVRYIHLPVRDARPIATSFLNAILSAIEDSLREGPLLVHCSAGISRSPAVVAAFLDRTGFMTFKSALDFLEQLRPAVNPSAVLVESIASELNTHN